MIINRLLFILLVSVLIGSLSVLNAQNRITVHPQEYPDAFRNPLKGFRTNLNQAGNPDYPYTSIVRHYIKWNEIENSSSDGLQEILDFCNEQWKGLEEINIKVIPRIYIDWDKREGNEFWPKDLENYIQHDLGKETWDETLWNDPVIKERIVKLVYKLGKAWDNDPRVAWIQTGLIGYWGEQEKPVGVHEDGWAKRLGEAYSKAFTNKKLIVRNQRYWDTEGYEWGVYWDSYGHPGQRNGAWKNIQNTNATSRYKTQIIEGEVAYNWGIDLLEPLYGVMPEITLNNDQYTNNMIDVIKELHCTGLGWISNYKLDGSNDTNPDSVRANADRMQKEFGYRFIIPGFSCPSRADQGGKLEINFTVKNVGSAPFYENWPLAFVLIDDITHEIVWKEILKDTDIRTWLPGDDYSYISRTYQTPAQKFVIDTSLTVPGDIPTGRYLAGITILEPNSQTPGVFFAIKNFLAKSQTQPLCRIGIGEDINGAYEIDPTIFGDPHDDDKRFYYSSNKAGDKKGTVHIFKAEDMELDGYEINSDDTRTFIKLTEPVGVASFTFPFPSGHYDIDVSYLAESVGQNVYTMYIADNQIVAWLGKPIDDQWYMLSDQRWHVPRHIEINKGDEVRVEALSENGSMVIFDYIQFAPSGRVVAAPVSETSGHSAAQTAVEILSSPDDYITVYPEEYERAIRNTLKGFRPGSSEHEYGTLTKTYFKWNDLENNVGDGVDKIIEASNKSWEGFEKRNLKAIPRVYLDWPRREGSWPEDMKEGDYTSEQFKERVLNMIKKLGEAWDNDPRVAYVEMGLIGYWGEQEFPDTKDEIKEAIAAQFAASFQNKLVMIRWPNTYNDHIYNFGYYWDSFAHHDQEYYEFHLNKTSPKWKTAVIGGETAYNWGNKNIQPGESPNATLTTPVHRDYIIDRIRKLHANHVGWIANYDNNDERVRAGADLVQKALGYRFVLTEVSYPKTIRSDEKFTFSFKVKNTGSTPFYYNWPTEVSLLDPVSKEPVWRQQCTNIDIRTWLPGDQWDDSARKYTIPAEIFTVNQSMTLSDVPQGGYIFTLAILDPAGYLPSARFAVKNYFNGGRHPIGKVGVNEVIDSYSVAGFDDIQKDNALFYILPDN